MNQQRQAWWAARATETGRELRGKGSDASGVTVEFSLIMGAVAIVALLVMWWLAWPSTMAARALLDGMNDAMNEGASTVLYAIGIPILIAALARAAVQDQLTKQLEAGETLRRDLEVVHTERAQAREDAAGARGEATVLREEVARLRADAERSK